MYRIQAIQALQPDQKPRLLELWNREFAVNVSLTDLGALDAYLSKLGDIRHLLLMAPDDGIAGWAFAFDRAGARWFTIVLDAAAQGTGFGRMMMAYLQETEPELNGWVVDNGACLKADGRPYPSPLEFYRRLGFSVLNERLEDGPVSAVRIKWRSFESGDRRNIAGLSCT